MRNLLVGSQSPKKVAHSPVSNHNVQYSCYANALKQSKSEEEKCETREKLGFETKTMNAVIYSNKLLKFAPV